MSGRLRLKINGTIPGFATGSIVEIDVDDEGTPVEQLWRRRLKDAEVDNCVSVVEDEKAPPKQDKKSKPRRSEKT